MKSARLVFKFFCSLCLIYCVFFISCQSSNYIEKEYEVNLKKLKTCEPYTDEPVAFEIKYLVDAEQAAVIREYFKENAGLDLEALAASSKSTWEKSVELACFVAKNIPHDNQKEWIDDR
ncbi:MAG: hypothetical protein IKR45_02335, partial [Treponema sp.]|nr:hypothetical protein [Treponema sp.]